MMKRTVPIGAAVLGIALLFPRDAFAYLDPGSGSLIFQTIVAAAAGVAYGVRVYWGRITGWFRRSSTDATPIDTPIDPPANPRG